uniref:F-box domain-containing protein n=1 Tax=Parastrongyloides trichosuri TaxID=131310 RepID=A0A0N4Z8Q4_PARTI
MSKYDNIIKALNERQVLKRVLMNLMDDDIMNLNYVCKDINQAIKNFKHYEIIPVEKIHLSVPMTGPIVTYNIKPKCFDPNNIIKIIFDFSIFGDTKLEKSVENIYIPIFKKMFQDVNKILSICRNSIDLEFHTYFGFFGNYIVNYISQLSYCHNVRMDFYFKTWSSYGDFFPPDFNMFQGFNNLKSITLISNFSYGVDICKYIVACAPDNNKFKINFNFNVYLNEYEWNNVRNILGCLKLKNLRFGLNCWGEDGSFMKYIPDIFTNDLVEKIYYLEINGDSFNLLKKFRPIIGKMKNLENLVCTFHIWEHVLRLITNSKTYFPEKLKHCHQLKTLRKLKNVSCTFKYANGMDSEKFENLQIIDNAFNYILDCLPESVLKLSIAGLRTFDENLTAKMHNILPNLIYLNLSKISTVKDGALDKLPNLRFLALHGTDKMKIPDTIVCVASVCCIMNEDVDNKNRFVKPYWKFCNCLNNHVQWRGAIGELQRFKKQLERSTEYNINIFYNNIKDGWNVLKVFTEEYPKDLYRDIYYRKNTFI